MSTMSRVIGNPKLGSGSLSRRSADVSSFVCPVYILLCYEVTFHAYRHMYLRSLDAASRGSKGGDVGFFPPTLTPALPTPLPPVLAPALPFPTPIPPFSASSSSPSTSARFVPGAGFSRIPRPEDGEGYKMKKVHQIQRHLLPTALREGRWQCKR